MKSPRLAFASFVRKGLATQASGGSSRLQVTAGLTLSDGSGAKEVISQKLQLLGPADVTGLEPSSIVRRDPTPGTGDFEPNYFPTLELVDEDLPWRFSPEPAATAAVRPWLALLALADEMPSQKAEFTRTTTGGRAAIRVAAKLLPGEPTLRLSAHVSFAADSEALVKGGAVEPAARAAIAKGEIDAIGRVLCLRRLAPRTRYVVFVVPTYELGRRAGLGMPISQQDLDATPIPAWDNTSEGEVELPVYDEWSFGTADEGDFESLVRRLIPHRGDPAASRAPLALADPGLSSHEGAVIEAALKHPDQVSVAPPAALVTAVAAVAGSAPRPSPPRYGAEHAPGAAWLDELSHDPRWRVAAGLGARAVRERQESFAAACWAQASAVREANQRIARLRAAELIAARLSERRVRPLRDEAVASLCAPFATRLATAGSRTLHAEAAKTTLGSVALEPIARRLLRDGGPLAARAGASGKGAHAALLSRLAGGSRLEPPKIAPKAITAARIAERAKLPTGAVAAALAKVPVSASKSKAAALTLGLQRAGTTLPDPPAKPPASLATWSPQLRAALDGGAAVRAVAAQTVRVEGKPPLDLAWACPRIEEGLVDDLYRLAPSRLVPDVSVLPQDAVAMYAVNAPFVHAFMVGFNHELLAELRWREYPLEGPCTFAVRFWEAASPGDPGDLRPLDKTLSARLEQLGARAGGASEPVVILIRGALVRRYPSLGIEAYGCKVVQGKRVPDATQITRPDLLTRLGDDMMLAVFFGLAASDVVPGKDDAPPLGWQKLMELRARPPATVSAKGRYFALFEHPQEARFGLDVVADASAPPSRDNLAFDSVGAPKPGEWLAPKAPLAIEGGIAVHESPAALAYALSQRPARVLVHSFRMLPPR